MLCVHNLARSAQAVELDLSAATRAARPVEIFGRSRFPRIGELPYLLTLAPRGFYWFQLVEDEPAMTDVADLSCAATTERCTTGSSPSAGSAPRRARSSHIDMLDAVTLRDGARRCSCCALVEARFPTGTHETYQVPLGLAPGRRGLGRARDRRGRRLDRLRRARRPRARAASCCTACARTPSSPARRACSLPLGAESRRRRRGGTVDVRPVGVEQSNSSIVFGDAADPEGVPRASSRA